MKNYFRTLMLLFLSSCHEPSMPDRYKAGLISFTVQPYDSKKQNKFGDLWVGFNKLNLKRNQDTLFVQVNGSINKNLLYDGGYEFRHDTLFLYAMQRARSSSDSVWGGLKYSILVKGHSYKTLRFEEWDSKQNAILSSRYTIKGADTSSGKNSSAIPQRKLPPTHIDSIDIASVLEKKLPLWVKYCQNSDSLFDLHEFHKSLSDSFQYEWNYGDAQNPDPDEKKYLWVASPDHKYLVNIYAYRAMIVREKGKVTISGGDPEWAIDLIDYRKNQTKRILMLGDKGSMDDIVWLDNNSFLVTGVNGSSCLDSKAFPYFSLYDLGQLRVLNGRWYPHGKWYNCDYLKNYKGPKQGVKWEL
jgi:hypothetical protein